MNRLFDETLSRERPDEMNTWAPSWVPLADVYDTPEAYLVEIELPGARPYLGTVGANLRLGNRHLDILGARLSGPDLVARAQGEILFPAEARSVRLDVQAEGRLELLDRLGWLDGQVAGPMTFDGGVSWSPDRWSVDGDVSSSALVLDERSLADLRGGLHVEPSRAQLRLETASYGGGRVHGTITVDLDTDSRATEADLTIDRVSLLRLASDQGLELEGLRGRITGVVNYRFLPAEPLLGSGWAELGVSSAAVGGSSVALTGTVPVVIRGGVARTQALRLTASDLRLVASGYFDLAAGTGRFDYEANTEAVERLVTLIPGQPEEPPAIWAPSRGSGRLSGVLFLEPERPSTTVSLDLVDVEAPGYRADRLEGTLTVGLEGVSGLRLELSRVGSALLLTGGLPFDPLMPLELTVDAVRWPLADARPWLPFDLPADGDMTGTVRLSGTTETLSGDVAGQVDPGEVLGIPCQVARVRLAFDPSLLTLEMLEVVEESGTVRLAGTVPLDGRPMELDLSSDHLDLGGEPFRSLMGERMGGTLELSGYIGGPLEEPEVVVFAEGRDLLLGGRDLGDRGYASGMAVWDGRAVTTSGSLLGLVTFDGGGRWDAEGLALDLALSVDDLRSLAVVASEAEVPSFGGRAEGRLGVRLPELAIGEVLEPVDPAAEPVVAATEMRLELSLLEIATGERRLRNLEPVVLALEDSRLLIESLYMGEEVEGTTSDLFLAGSVGLEGEMPLDLRLQSSFDAVWMRLLLPDLAPEGSVDLIANIGGTLGEPAFNGQGEIRRGRLVIEGLGQTVEDLQATLLFYPKQVVVDSATARGAGGTLRAGGNVRLYEGAEGDSIAYRLQLSAEKLSLRWPEGWLMQGGAELVLSSDGPGREIRGAVNLERALYFQPLDLGLAQMMQRFFQRQRLQVESTDDVLAGTAINLSVRGPGALRVRNNLADLRGDIDLTVRGTLARPVLFGRVELERDGTLEYAGNEYEVQRGLLTFVNPYAIEPIIDLVATTRASEYEVTLNLSGTPDRLNATFASDPPLPDLEILALVSTGSATQSAALQGGAGASDSGAGSMAAESFLYGQAASLISDRVNNLFNLDRFRIAPLTGESGGPTSARVTVGKRLNRDLFATYSYDPSETDQQILQVEWQVSPQFTLVVTQNGDGSYAVDGRWENRF